MLHYTFSGFNVSVHGDASLVYVCISLALSYGILAYSYT